MQHDFSFWPFRGSVAIVAMPLLLVIMLTAWAVVEAVVDMGVHPGWLLLGIVVVAGLPLFLHVLDGLSAGGGSVEIASVRIALSDVASSTASLAVPRNAGLQAGERLSDSGNAEIEQMLKSSRTSGVAVVDLEDGTAWWTTRLLILASGAARLRRPQAIVFVATIEGTSNSFVGWAAPSDVRDALLASNPGLSNSYATAAATANEWRHVKPGTPSASIVPTPDFAHLVSPEQPGFPSIVVDEKVLAAQLAPIEATSEDLSVDVADLNRWLAPSIRRQAIDQAAEDREWIASAISSEEGYVAVTNRAQYVALMSRTAVTNSILSALSEGWLSSKG